MGVANLSQSSSRSAELPNTNPQNSIEELASWLRSDETPLIYKIGAIALPVILGYAIGAVIGYPLLTAAIVTLAAGTVALIGFCTLMSREQSALDVAERSRILAQEMATAFTNMKNAVGGEEAFNALPEFQMGDQMGSTGCLDFLRPADLSHSVMRGTDRIGRPFISLKLQVNSPNAPRDPFVITFHQRFTNSDLWSYGTRGGRIEDAEGNPFFGTLIRAVDRALIHQIVVERNHPFITLVN